MAVLSLFLHYSIIGPLGSAAVLTCLTPESWEIGTRIRMGVVYIDYPDTVKSINDSRFKLVGPSVAILFHAGTNVWCRITHVATVYRN